jgi:hypothetical protein
MRRIVIGLVIGAALIVGLLLFGGGRIPTGPNGEPVFGRVGPLPTPTQSPPP